MSVQVFTLLLGNGSDVLSSPRTAVSATTERDADPSARVSDHCPVVVEYDVDSLPRRAGRPQRPGSALRTTRCAAVSGRWLGTLTEEMCDHVMKRKAMTAAIEIARPLLRRLMSTAS